MPFLSVIIPAYNEEARLDPTLEKITGYFAAQAYDTEIVVVDDGSSDRTVEIVGAWMEKSPVTVRLARNPRNLGKGMAVKNGMLAAAGQYRLFSDADLSTPMAMFERFLPLLRQGKEVVIGTRKHPDAEITQRQPWLRRNMAKVFVLLANLLLGLRLTDFTCGFKCFSARAAEEIFSRSRIPGWAYDGEILFLAKQLGFEIVEAPVVWAHASGSRVKLRRDVINSLAGLLQIRGLYWRGVYHLPRPGAKS
jgi:dolichyl-phosphate beta-glucosyltransferase